MYIRNRVLSMGIIVFLIFVLLAGGCIAKETAPAPYPSVPSSAKPSTLIPTPDKPITILPEKSSFSPWPPIIDAHAHLPGGSLSEQIAYIDGLVAEMDRLGVVKATLEGLPPKRTPKVDQDILAAYERYPDRFYPYLSGFDPQDEGAIDYVRKQLETGKWRGLGEIYLRQSPAGVRNPADHPVMLKIYDLCAEYNVPIHVHFEPDYGIAYEQGIEEIKRALAHNQKTIFIWAHNCHGNIRLLDEFPNLYAEGNNLPGILLDKKLTDRFMFGTDVGLPGVILCGGGNYAEGVAKIRALLSSLDQTTGEKLAFRNIATLMKDELLVQGLGRRRPPASTPTPTPSSVSIPAYTPPPPRPATPFVTKKEEGILFQDDFEDGRTDGWQLGKDWEVVREDGNNVLRGRGERVNAFPIASVSGGWTDYTIEAMVKVVAGQVMFNFRQSQGAPGIGGNTYSFGIQQGSAFSLTKNIERDFFRLTPPAVSDLKRDKWYKVKLALNGNNIKLYLDSDLKIDYTDDDIPIRVGGLMFITTSSDSLVYLDNIKVTGVKVIQRSKWVKTGGPSGGLGYDVRIHPKDKNIMFVTDNPSGVNKSYDAGANWVAKNDGITARAGASLDGIPVFCLTIDPNNPDIVWAGTQFMRGIYKSTDCGETWTKKDNGVTEWDDITFRGFAVRFGDSNTVFAAAEKHTGVQGSQFEKVKGKIYKTGDGGENWRCVWEGTSLARFVLINPLDPDIMYASTGIFDREAYNDTPVGVLKSTDGGKTWKQINNGIDNLFVGYLDMHPTNPDILFAAAGNCISPWDDGRIYRTTDGGEHWAKVLSGDRFSVVTISPANPRVIYAAGCGAFWRSDDGGDSWQSFTIIKGRLLWGPPGMKVGQPIGIVADPDDPMTVYVNNYTGGVFKSSDGGKTWVDWSNGYTGIDMYTVVTYPANPNIVYAGSRSGISGSRDGGGSWNGLIYPDFPGYAEVTAIAVNPQNPMEILAGEAQNALISSSLNGGTSWRQVYQHPQAQKVGGPGGADPSNWHRFTCITYALSNPKVVYAGIRKTGPSITEIYYEPSLGLVKSVDGGSTWTEINSGLENSRKSINCIAIHPQNPDIAYAGTLQDGVFKTTDGGKHWTPVNSGLMSLDVRSLAIDPKSPDTVYAGLGEGAGIFKTTNGGELWEGVNYGIRVECPSYLQRVGQVRPGVSLVKPKRLVGGDYVSVPWTVITSIAIDPVDPLIVYAADYFLGVYMSTDGGLNWDSINEGLSTKAVRALALSADGWVLYAATSGEGVFRLALW